MISSEENNDSINTPPKRSIKSPFSSNIRSNDNSLLERESLGILNTSLLKDLKSKDEDSLDRESLGILHMISPNIYFKSEKNNTTRDENKENNDDFIFKTPKKRSAKKLRSNKSNSSLNTSNNSFDGVGRKLENSFELLNEDMLENIDPTRESIPYFSNKQFSYIRKNTNADESRKITDVESMKKTIDDEPRESLGILNLNLPNFLDIASLDLPSYQKLVSSCKADSLTSSDASNLPLNGKSLDDSIGSSNPEKTCTTSASVDKNTSVGREEKENNISLPREVLQLQKWAEAEREKIRLCWSAQKPKRSNTLVRRASCGNICSYKEEKTEESNNFLNESFAVEAKYIAWKMSDGSILESPENGNGILDSTPQPAWDDIDGLDSSKEDKDDTEKVFKTVDKMLAPLINMPLKSETKIDSPVTSNADYSENFISPLCNADNTNKSIANNEQSINTEKHSDFMNNEKSEDAMHVMQNLMEMTQYQSKVQHTLLNLANILWKDGARRFTINNTPETLEDSGRSSIEVPHKHDMEDFNKNLKVLGMKTEKLSTNEESPKPLDLSTKLASVQSGIANINKSSAKIQEGSVNSVNKLSMNNSSKVSNDSKDSFKSFNSFGSNNSTKLKPRRTEPSILKKGPLKAIGPIVAMTKRNSLNNDLNRTPPLATSSLLERRKITTPKLSQNMKPVAQSTPEAVIPMKRSGIPTSPVSRLSLSSHTGNQFLNRSGSHPQIKSSKTAGNTSNLRRYSFSSSIKPPNNKVGVKTDGNIQKKIDGRVVKADSQQVLRDRSRSMSYHSRPSNLAAKLKGSAN